MVDGLKAQLAKINLRKVKTASGETLEERMANEARRLYDCIQYYIDEWHRSYEPVIYQRSYRYQGALYAEDIADITTRGNSLVIKVAFHKDLTRHPNLNEVSWNRYGYNYDVPINDRHMSRVDVLMEKGWNAPRLASMLGRNVHMLTYFEGIHAIEKGVRDYNATNKLGIRVNADNILNASVY